MTRSRTVQQAGGPHTATAGYPGLSARVPNGRGGRPTGPKASSSSGAPLHYNKPAKQTCDPKSLHVPLAETIASSNVPLARWGSHHLHGLRKRNTKSTHGRDESFYQQHVGHAQALCSKPCGVLRIWRSSPRSKTTPNVRKKWGGVITTPFRLYIGKSASGAGKYSTPSHTYLEESMGGDGVAHALITTMADMLINLLSRHCVGP